MLRSLAIGSCVVVVAYDVTEGVGALAHVVLPGKARRSVVEKTRYADDAIEELLAVMAGAGSRMPDVEVCLVGAGNVLGRADDTICASNIHSVMSSLGMKGIPIRAMVLGGIERKSACLCVKTGRVSYTVGDSEERMLWEPGAGGEGVSCGESTHGQ